MEYATELQNHDLFMLHPKDSRSVETGATTGIALRDESGRLLKDKIPEALKKMKELGVSTWAVIHCPNYLI